MELWNDALVATCEGQSRRRLSHPRLSANTAMLRTACFLCVIGHRELLGNMRDLGLFSEGVRLSYDRKKLVNCPFISSTSALGPLQEMTLATSFRIYPK